MAWFHAVVYLGFQKGGKCLLATSAHRKGQTKFSNFFAMSKEIFWPKGGHGRFGKGSEYATGFPGRRYRGTKDLRNSI